MDIVPPRPHDDSTGYIMRRLTLDERRTASADASLTTFRRSPSSLGSSSPLYLIKRAASPRATFHAGRCASARNRRDVIERPLLGCRIRAILRAIRRLIDAPLLYLGAEIGWRLPAASHSDL